MITLKNADTVNIIENSIFTRHIESNSYGNCTDYKFENENMIVNYNAVYGYGGRIFFSSETRTVNKNDNINHLYTEVVIHTEYDNTDGHCPIGRRKYKDGELLVDEKYVYLNNLSNHSYASDYVAVDKVSGRITKSYFDGFCRLICRVVMNNTSISKKITCKYENKSDGHLLQEEVIDYDNSGHRIANFKYDSDGNLVEKQILDIARNEELFHRYYEYDSHNNFIRETMYNNRSWGVWC